MDILSYTPSTRQSYSARSFRAAVFARARDVPYVDGRKADRALGLVAFGRVVHFVHVASSLGLACSRRSAFPPRPQYGKPISTISTQHHDDRTVHSTFCEVIKTPCVCLSNISTTPRRTTTQPPRCPKNAVGLRRIDFTYWVLVSYWFRYLNRF